jgi:hypothetical protein
VHQGGKHSLLVRQAVLQPGIQTEAGVGGLPVHFMTLADLLLSHLGNSPHNVKNFDDLICPLDPLWVKPMDIIRFSIASLFAKVPLGML